MERHSHLSLLFLLHCVYFSISSAGGGFFLLLFERREASSKASLIQEGESHAMLRSQLISNVLVLHCCLKNYPELLWLI